VAQDVLGNSTTNTIRIILDTAPPILVITNLTMWQRVSNVSFTVKGNAADNTGVGAVWCQVNSNGWQLANGTSPWSVPLTLQPGTNRFEAYAQDAVGNRGLTTNVSFVCIVGDTLRIVKIGQGTLTPNLAGVSVPVGLGTNMTAAGTNGHWFSHWVTATNWGEGVASRVARLDFLMQSNLTLTVVFADTNRPMVTITNLNSMPTISDPLFLARGTNRDNVGVDKVCYQLTNRVKVGLWVTNQAGSSNAWAAPLDPNVLMPGTNTFRIFAQDAATNVSATASTNFVFPLKSDWLRVRIEGEGVLTPDYSGRLLAIGANYTNYTMTAAGTNGYQFRQWIVATNWGAGATSSLPAVRVMMQTNLTLTAVFANTNAPLNHPPVAVGQILSTAQNRPVSLAVSNLLAQCNDLDNDPIALAAVAGSTNGAPVSLTGSQITYSPLTDFVGVDRFSYTIGDGRGGTASAEVRVDVYPGGVPGLHVMEIEKMVQGVRLRIAGIPGRTYQIRRAPSLEGPWEIIDSVVAGAGAVVDWVETTSPPGQGFYQVTGAQ
jgi:hypothetical protein